MQLNEKLESTTQVPCTHGLLAHGLAAIISKVFGIYAFFIYLFIYLFIR